MIKKKNKNILIVIPSLTFGGGAEKVAVDIGNELYKRSNNITYLTFHYDIKTYSYFGKYISLNQDTQLFFKILFIPYNSYKIYKYCKLNNIDIIISHMERANIISIISKIFLKNIKQISVVHNHRYSLSIFNSCLIKIFYKYSDKIVCVSETIENMLKSKFNLSNTKTIYNAFNFEEINKLSKLNIKKNDEKYFSKDYFTFINIGRLTKQKGHKFLIKSFSHLLKKHSKARLIIIGEGELREELEYLIKDLGIENNVFLIGRIDNIFRYLKISNAFIFSSLWEGFGLVLVEALSLGLPIISTDCLAGPREILAPELEQNKKIKYPYYGKYGILCSVFENENNIKEYSNVMMDIIKKGFIKQKGGINRFDINYIIEKWEKLY